MNELFPILAGLVIGAVIGAGRRRASVPVTIAVSLMVGVAATVVSGEIRLTWAYLLVDVPLVGLAVTTASLFTQRLRGRVPRAAMSIPAAAPADGPTASPTRSASGRRPTGR